MVGICPANCGSFACNGVHVDWERSVAPKIQAKQRDVFVGQIEPFPKDGHDGT
jgi:hypothetical protein